WWPELRDQLAKVPKTPPAAVQQRSDRALLEEILQIVRRPSPQTVASSATNQKPRGLHGQLDAELQAMSLAGLADYLVALEKRWAETPNLREEDALEKKMVIVRSEIAKREKLEEPGSLSATPPAAS